MKLRKLAALTMAGVLAAAGLSACGGGSAPDTGAAAEAGESKGQALAGDNAEPDVVLQEMCIRDRPWPGTAGIS